MVTGKLHCQHTEGIPQMVQPIRGVGETGVIRRACVCVCVCVGGGGHTYTCMCIIKIVVRSAGWWPCERLSNIGGASGEGVW